jgi:hypothetical protein
MLRRHRFLLALLRLKLQNSEFGNIKKTGIILAIFSPKESKMDFLGNNTKCFVLIRI